MARILVVEDEPDSRDMLAELLASEGYEVVTAENGLVGLEQARVADVDLILTDLMMPYMDGEQMLGELEKDERLRKIPLIVISAGLGEEIARRFGHAYARKPLDIDPLLRSIRRLVCD